tara:strand:- start:896 stop:1681 length:786 start_codon:yes stop_codon:yes gene_type:complete
MNKRLVIICGLVLIAASFSYGGYRYGQHSAGIETKTQLQKVINWNTKQIHSLGVTAATDKHNAELLIQILNGLEGNPVKPVPKFIPLGDIVSSDPIVEDNDVPLTFEQVFKDQREVDQSIRAFASANLFQAETLHNILGQVTDSTFDNEVSTFGASPRHGTERYWQDVIQEEVGGEKEYRLDDGTRVDLLFPHQAAEIDWADKWAEGIGQSIYYGLKTERDSLVILLAKKDGWEKYRDRVEYCNIPCWVFDTRTEEWVDKE